MTKRPKKVLISTNDQNILAKLVQSYGLDVIVSAAPTAKIFSRGRPRRSGGQSSILQSVPRSAEQLLAKLVQAYGVDLVTQAAPFARLSPRGRPSRGDRPLYERINYADWIEEEAERLRAIGVRHPVKQALINAYEMEFGDASHPSESQIATIKKKYLKGRRDLLESGAALRVRWKKFKRI